MSLLYQIKFISSDGNEITFFEVDGRSVKEALRNGIDILEDYDLEMPFVAKRAVISKGTLCLADIDLNKTH